MATRQLRISDGRQIRQRLPQWVGQKVNIVLRDGTALLGVLTRADDQHVEMRNMARGRHRFLVSSIAELYIDSID